jgi:predicted transposase/invertase (TIGR01784 family)
MRGLEQIFLKILKQIPAKNILDFAYIPLKDFHTSFHLWEDRDKSYMLTGALEIHFLEMTKFRTLGEKDIEHNALHRWLSYFDQGAPEQLIEEIVTMDPVIKKTQAVMDQISRDEGLRHAYDMHQLALMDERNLQYRIAEGTKEGIKKGIKQGIKEGRDQTLLELAKKLKELGDPAEKISTVTGLSIEEIQAL